GIVDDCSDTDQAEKGPWRPRKEAYIAHLEDAEAPSLRVSLADKLHNARSILFDLRTDGPSFWGRFSVTDPAEQLWYYRSLSDVFLERREEAGPMAVELARVVDDIEREIAGSTR
nr:phosphohydrolase [Thermoleophilaceae bacterium]